MSSGCSRTKCRYSSLVTWPQVSQSGLGTKAFADMRKPFVAVAALLLPCLRAQDGSAGALDESLYDTTGTAYTPPPAANTPAAKTSPDSCVFRKNGASFDLAPMFRNDHDFTGTTNGGYAYRFNVCGNTVKLCNQQPAPASKWRGSKCNNLGDPSTQTISLLDEKAPAKGLRLQYSKGDICKQQQAGTMQVAARTVTYEITCNPYAHPGELKLIKENNMCDYTIVFESEHACPTNRSRIHGWLLITLFTLSVIGYCGVGIYLNKKNHEKQGVEAIPHVEYWEQVPGLVRDGVQFSYEQSKVAAEFTMTHGRGAYESTPPHCWYC